VEQKLSRKELKQMVRQDRFREEVSHTVEYVAKHKKHFVIYGVLAVVLMIGAGITYWYMQRQQAVRQAELYQALRVQDATIGPAQNEYALAFPTAAEKQKAVADAFQGILNKYPNSDEGLIAKYYLGVNAADQGKTPDAEKYFRQVADSGKEDYASLAKLALADLLVSQNRKDEAEKLLRSLVAKPTVFVSKEHATIELAKLIGTSKPEEARKLLEPLRTERSAVSRAALTALSKLPAKN
jgi:TolA-binding protein